MKDSLEVISDAIDTLRHSELLEVQQRAESAIFNMKSSVKMTTEDEQIKYDIAYNQARIDAVNALVEVFNKFRGV